MLPDLIAARETLQEQHDSFQKGAGRTFAAAMFEAPGPGEPDDLAGGTPSFEPLQDWPTTSGPDAIAPGKTSLHVNRGIVEPEKYPPIEEIRNRWEQVTDTVRGRLNELTAEELSEPGKRLPIEMPDLLGGFTFLVWHESYHVGQMGYVRKWLTSQSPDRRRFLTTVNDRRPRMSDRRERPTPDFPDSPR